VDEIARLFADITPEDVINARGSGADLFSAFVAEMHDRTRTVYVQAGGTFDPLVVLQRDSNRRVLKAHDDETNIDYVHRLHRSAQRFGATWLYLAQIIPVAVHRDPATAPVKELSRVDYASTTSIFAARQRGLFTDELAWYAEAREPGGQTIRIGVFTRDRGVLGEVVEGHASGASWMYRGILDPAGPRLPGR
jgi:hypothetical protein